jgi:hypothetical protein
MSWQKVDRYVGITLSGMMFLYFTASGVYAYHSTELWTRWYFPVCFIPTWMVGTALLLGELGLVSLKENTANGKNYQMKWLNTVKEMLT